MSLFLKNILLFLYAILEKLLNSCPNGKKHNKIKGLFGQELVQTLAQLLPGGLTLAQGAPMSGF